MRFRPRLHEYWNIVFKRIDSKVDDRVRCGTWIVLRLDLQNLIQPEAERISKSWTKRQLLILSRSKLVVKRTSWYDVIPPLWEGERVTIRYDYTTAYQFNHYKKISYWTFLRIPDHKVRFDA
jgi:hypothetical protein